MDMNKNLVPFGFFSDFFTLWVNIKHSYTFLELSASSQLHC